MGDEVRRTQRGNNNAYCQDNEISWFDWSLLERHADIHRFVKLLNAFRQRATSWTDGTLSLNQLLQRAASSGTAWRSTVPDWSDTRTRWRSRCEACTAFSAPRDAQRLLGAADVRAAARLRRDGQHPGGAASTRRCRRPMTSTLGRGAAGSALDLCRAAAIVRRARLAQPGTGHRPARGGIDDVHPLAGALAPRIFSSMSIGLRVEYYSAQARRPDQPSA